MKLPDFIIAGSNKCGTTAMWYNLDKHPDIHMGTKTDTSIEVHFWDGKMFSKGLDWYRSRFTGHKLNGEKTPRYIRKRGWMHRMHQFLPNIKLIFCFRNPVDRAYSSFQMNRNNGKVKNFNSDTFKKLYASHGKYYHQLERNVMPFFKRSQIHICITEYLKKNTTEEMRKVFEFLGVSDLNLPRKEIHGVLLKHRSRQEDIQKSRQEPYYRVWSKHKGVLSGDLRQEVLDFYKPHNQALFDFLGYEIEEWKV